MNPDLLHDIYMISSKVKQKLFTQVADAWNFLVPGDRFKQVIISSIIVVPIEYNKLLEKVLTCEHRCQQGEN